VGNSFSENDVIAEDVMMPKLRIGEVMVISNAGSYPLVFQRLSSDKEKTAQIFFTVDGEVKL
jgi:diaminopimelate decarboxylase